MIEAYYHALKGYHDEDIQEAGYKCLDNCEYFPKPVDISKQIREIQRNNPLVNRDEDFIIRYDVRCRKCGHIGLGIKEPKETGEWQCRECYTGLTTEQIKEKFRAIWKIFENKSDLNIPTEKTDYENNERQNILTEQAKQLTDSISDEDIPI
jgi:hypothetical protein